MSNNLQTPPIPCTSLYKLHAPFDPRQPSVVWKLGRLQRATRRSKCRQTRPFILWSPWNRDRAVCSLKKLPHAPRKKQRSKKTKWITVIGWNVMVRLGYERSTTDLNMSMTAIKIGICGLVIRYNLITGRGEYVVDMVITSGTTYRRLLSTRPPSLSSRNAWQETHQEMR